MKYRRSPAEGQTPVNRDDLIGRNQSAMRLFEECINNNDIGLGRCLIDDDARFTTPVSPTPLRGAEGYLSVVTLMRASFPDIRWKLERMVADGHTAAVQWLCSGTFTGNRPFAGISPNGRGFSTVVMNFYSFNDDGKIVGDTAAAGVAGIVQGIKEPAAGDGSPGAFCRLADKCTVPGLFARLRLKTAVEDDDDEIRERTKDEFYDPPCTDVLMSSNPLGQLEKLTAKILRTADDSLSCLKRDPDFAKDLVERRLQIVRIEADKLRTLIDALHD